MLIADPYQTSTVEVEGVTYFVRGMSDREKFSIFPDALIKVEGSVRANQEVIGNVVQTCLVNWEGPAPHPFDKHSPKLNVDRLETAEILAIFYKALAMSRLPVLDVQSLESQS